jgi:NAD-dependent deacetylase
MKHLVILTGAGISAESGIRTFRDSNGLWEEYPIEEVATPQAWKRNPQKVQEFYNLRRKQVIDAQPNAAHAYFAGLEEYFRISVITQNIDDLHERAGSSNVLHLHGNIRLAKSSGPDPDRQFYPVNGDAISMEDHCERGYVLRPHVVWFGEEVPELERAAAICREADCLVVVGTSLQVYPAAGLAFAAAPGIPKFLLDPQSEDLEVGNDFVKLPFSAVEGVKILDRLLHELWTVNNISHETKKP